MPELPEVETVRTGLHRSLAGSTIESVQLLRPDLRIPFPAHLAKTLAGRKIRGITRRAKYLLWDLDSDDVILSHLGMSGRFIVRSTPEPPAIHDHMELRMTDGRQVLYHDPRRFGLITLSSRKELVGHPLLVHLGPEPLNEEFDAAYLKKVLATRKGPVKAALMDQALVVGVGNIYASEALYISGLHPLKPANSCAGKANALVPAIRHVLQAAITSGGSSLRDFLDISGETGYFQHGFAVYGREGKPCKHCKTAIENIKITGRSSFFCPECQRL